MVEAIALVELQLSECLIPEQYLLRFLLVLAMLNVAGYAVFVVERIHHLAELNQIQYRVWMQFHAQYRCNQALAAIIANNYGVPLL